VNLQNEATGPVRTRIRKSKAWRSPQTPHPSTHMMCGNALLQIPLPASWNSNAYSGFATSQCARRGGLIFVPMRSKLVGQLAARPRTILEFFGPALVQHDLTIC